MKRLFEKTQRRFSRFDMFVYWLFYKVWSKHFTAYPDVRKMFLKWMQDFDEHRSQPIGQLRLASHNPNPQPRGTPPRPELPELEEGARGPL